MLTYTDCKLCTHFFNNKCFKQNSNFLKENVTCNEYSFYQKPTAVKKKPIVHNNKYCIAHVRVL